MIGNINSLSIPKMQYLTFQDVRDEGITASIVSDVRLKKLILRYSRMAELYTNQWFGPVFGKAKINGYGTGSISLGNNIPILKVVSIESTLDTVGSGIHSHLRRGYYVNGVLSNDEYSISDTKRAIELISPNVSSTYGYYSDCLSSTKRLFPDGVSNIIIDGVFGYLVNIKEVSSDTVSLVNVNDTIISVVDSSIFSEGDIIAIDILGVKYYNIISSVDLGLNQITINPSDISIPIGSKVYSYGAVHPLISFAIMKLVINNRGQLGATASALINPQAMLSEKTDNYTYRLSEDIMLEASKGSTGDIEVDKIFNEFRSGTITGFVV